MKTFSKILAFILCVCLLCSLGACVTVKRIVSTEDETASPAEPEPTDQSGGEDVPETGIDALSPEERADLARQFIGRELSELVSVFGEPLSFDYAAASADGGEDGELIYEDFTVYTYRDNESEIIQEVLE